MCDINPFNYPKYVNLDLNQPLLSDLTSPEPGIPEIPTHFYTLSTQQQPQNGNHKIQNFENNTEAGLNTIPLNENTKENNSKNSKDEKIKKRQRPFEKEQKNAKHKIRTAKSLSKEQQKLHKNWISYKKVHHVLPSSLRYFHSELYDIKESVEIINLDTKENESQVGNSRKYYKGFCSDSTVYEVGDWIVLNYGERIGFGVVRFFILEIDQRMLVTVTKLEPKAGIIIYDSNNPIAANDLRIGKDKTLSVSFLSGFVNIEDSQ